jgi:hypothetical protein
MILNVFAFHFLNTVVTSVQNQSSTLREFSERFKYDVISSSLLSSSITAPSSTRRRSSSLDDSLSDDPIPNSTTLLPPPPFNPPVIHHSLARSLFLFCLCPISLFLDCFMLYLLVGTILYYLESHPIASLPDYISPVGASRQVSPFLLITLPAQTFGSLSDLIAAANLWDSTVHEAINLLEVEESMYVTAVPLIVVKPTTFHQGALLPTLFATSRGSPYCSPEHTGPI